MSLLSRKLSVDQIHESCRLWFIHMKEDFPLSSEFVIKKLFGILWFLLPFMAFFFLLLVIHWVIVYSCTIKSIYMQSGMDTRHPCALNFRTHRCPSSHRTVFHSILVLMMWLCYKISCCSIYFALDFQCYSEWKKETHLKADVKNHQLHLQSRCAASKM